jgi:hypothetical protein
MESRVERRERFEPEKKIAGIFPSVSGNPAADTDARFSSKELRRNFARRVVPGGVSFSAGPAASAQRPGGLARVGEATMRFPCASQRRRKRNAAALTIVIRKKYQPFQRRAPWSHHQFGRHEAAGKRPRPMSPRQVGRHDAHLARAAAGVLCGGRARGIPTSALSSAGQAVGETSTIDGPLCCSPLSLVLR